MVAVVVAAVIMGGERERETTTTAETIAVPVRDFSLFAGFSFLFYIEI